MDAALFATIALMVLIAAIAAGAWSRSRSARPVVGGIGFMLIPLGLYLLGVMRLAYNGVVSIVDWIARTVWDQTMTWGIALFGVGLVLLVVAGAMKAKPRAARPAKATPATGPAGAKPAVGAAPPAASPAKPAAPSKPGAKSEADPEDAEIEAILRRRGIM